MTDTNFDLVVIGGGNMGAALVGGLLSGDVWGPAELAIVEVLESRRTELAEMFHGVEIVDQVPNASAAIVAVKPAQVHDAVRSVVDAGVTRVLSLAAGVRLASLDAVAGGDVAVVRAMPNTPALVGLGASAIAPGAGAGDDDLDWAASILGAVGTVSRMDEAHLDAFTGVAGSGPAYVFLIAEALIDAAVAEGIPRHEAEPIVRQLLLGSATLLAGGEEPSRLRANVTSPGGTTAAGIARLEAHAVRAAIADAVHAAAERSRELG